MNLMKQARQSQGKTQKDFARRLGVTQQVVSSWENTGRIPEDRKPEVYGLYGIKPDDDLQQVSDADRDLISLLLRYGNQAIKDELREKLERIRSFL